MQEELIRNRISFNHHGRIRMMKKIAEIVDLNQIPSSRSQVIGISNLNCLEHIQKKDIQDSRGEFAGFFVNGDRVTLFRDRVGARNIYYTIDNEQIFISTDLEWLAKNVETEPNWQYILSDYLQFQIPFSDDTFFSKIKKVMPGEFVYLEKGKVMTERYWNLKFGNAQFDAKHLLKLIRDAVTYRLSLIGDNYTAYLSGGIDSSTITLLSRPKDCFSGFYKADGYSELDHIETVISKADFPCENTQVQITEDCFQNCLEKLPEILKDPCCGLGAIPQVLVGEQAAKEGYQYAFTGEGGDEIFLGYNWNTIVFSLANSARALLRDRYMVRYEPMIEKVLRDGFSTFTGGLLSRGNDIAYATKRILEVWDQSESVENNILKINLRIGLPAILTLDEAVGIYCGIEPVSPLVDHNIIEYVCSINPQERAPIPKFLFREALKGTLPEKVRMRYDKMGFPVPYDRWNWEPHLSLIASLAERNFVDIDLDQHKTMDRQTWALYSIEAWFRHYFEK